MKISAVNKRPAFAISAKSPGCRNRSSGFTLLEVLVAIGVFSVVAMISYTALDTYLEQRERLTVHYAKLERLQRLFLMLERDLQSIARRPVREDGDLKPAVTSDADGALIAMTVAQPDLLSVTGFRLKRVAWRLDGEELIRSEWDNLDHNGTIEPRELLVDDGLSAIDFNYLIFSPGRGVESETGLDPDQFPSGIEVDVKLKTGEEYRRVIAISQGEG